MVAPHLTPQQQKWFASVRAGLERETGKSLAEWVAIAKTCPQTRPRARLAWFKETHGLLQNRASYVISEAFGSEMPWDDPDTLIDALWTDPLQRAIFEAVRAKALDLPDTVVGPRKGFTGFSRKYQYAAAKPHKAGAVILGLAVTADVDAGLEPRRTSETLNERLLSILLLGSVSAIDERVGRLLKVAWERS